MQLIFVHGRLRQGKSDHALLASGTFVGVGVTASEFALYLIQDKAVITKRPAMPIKGEVYKVSKEILHVVDRLEGHPYLNKREREQIILQDGQTVEAWIYFHVQPLRDAVLIESGDYCSQK